MSSETNLTESDKGKKVVDRNGDEVGRIVEVENGRGYIDPDPSVTVSVTLDRKSTRLNSSHIQKSRMPSSA